MTVEASAVTVTVFPTQLEPEATTDSAPTAPEAATEVTTAPGVEVNLTVMYLVVVDVEEMVVVGLERAAALETAAAGLETSAATMLAGFEA